MMTGRHQYYEAVWEGPDLVGELGRASASKQDEDEPQVKRKEEYSQRKQCIWFKEQMRISRSETEKFREECVHGINILPENISTKPVTTFSELLIQIYGFANLGH